MRMKLLAATTVATLAATLSACTGSTDESGSRPPGAVPGEDGCVSVVVATSSEKVNLMDELGVKFKDSPEADALDSCVSVFPLNVSSGKGAEILAGSPTSWPISDEAYWPTIWSPASTIWTDRIKAAGSNSIAEAESFTRTPIVLGVPETMADALGYPEKPISLQDIEGLISDPAGWGSVGKDIWGSFKVAKTNPNTSTTGLATILMQSYAASGKDKNLTVKDVEGAADFSRTFESGAIHYGDTTGNVLKTLASRAGSSSGSAYVSAVALEETSLYNYNIGNPDSHTVQPGETLTPPREKLIAVYPSGGSMWSDNPAVEITAPWVTTEQAEASKAFMQFLQTSPAQEVLPEFGFRPLDKTVKADSVLNASVGIDASQPKVTLPKPDPTVVSAALDQWADIRKPSAVLELIDISGSMDEPIGDGRTRLEGAVDGASTTLGNFRSSDEIGVWAFTTGVQSDVGKNLLSVRDFGLLAGDREKVESSVNDLLYTNGSNRNGTPLYDAISEAYDFMEARAETGRINAIVVLSDGEDTDSNIKLDSLIVKLNGSAKEGTTDSPVRIFAIAYGAGADKDALTRITQATGGQMFDASDPERIDAVFASVINNF